MKVASFLTQIILTSQTFFLVPFCSETESYKEAYPIFEQCFKYFIFLSKFNPFDRLSALKCILEKEMFDSSKKTNLLPYQIFAKQTDLSINESSMIGIKTPPNELSSVRDEKSGVHPFIAEGLSPINQNIRSNREGIYIQDNSGIDTPIKVFFLLFFRDIINKGSWAIKQNQE